MGNTPKITSHRSSDFDSGAPCSAHDPQGSAACTGIDTGWTTWATGPHRFIPDHPRGSAKPASGQSLASLYARSTCAYASASCSARCCRAYAGHANPSSGTASYLYGSLSTSIFGSCTPNNRDSSGGADNATDSTGWTDSPSVWNWHWRNHR